MSDYQPPLWLTYDPEKARAEALAGMARAESADRVQLWKELATDWLEQLSPGALFTSDDLIRTVGVAGIGANKNNVIGAFFSGAAKRGVIVWTGRFHNSERVVRRGVHRIWRKV